MLGVCVETASCRQAVVDGENGSVMAGPTIEEVLKRNSGRLMSVSGVVGTAISQCEGKPCIRVYVVKKTAEVTKQIPSVLEGYPVVVEETGPFRPFNRA
jgi:hypothetical protein